MSSNLLHSEQTLLTLISLSLNHQLYTDDTQLFILVSATDYLLQGS